CAREGDYYGSNYGYW
nr:immunoglobulin heavy chain junction region [Mus musculus]